MSKSKLYFAAIVAVIPNGRVRRWLWNSFFGYKIHPEARISLLTVIAVDQFEVDAGTEIGPLNVFKGPITVQIGKNSRIGRNNRFLCGFQITHEKYQHMSYARKFSMGDSCLILHGHYFDVYGEIKLANGSWIAGVDSQFWTHGVTAMDRDIEIGENNYIGSAVRFAPGSKIGNGNLVALGSVVLSKIEANDSLLSGFPAKVIKSIKEEKNAGRYRFSFDDWS